LLYGVIQESQNEHVGTLEKKILIDATKKPKRNWKKRRKFKMVNYRSVHWPNKATSVPKAEFMLQDGFSSLSNFEGMCAVFTSRCNLFLFIVIICLDGHFLNFL